MYCSKKLPENKKLQLLETWKNNLFSIDSIIHIETFSRIIKLHIKNTWNFLKIIFQGRNKWTELRRRCMIILSRVKSRFNVVYIVENLVVIEADIGGVIEVQWQKRVYTFFVYIFVFQWPVVDLLPAGPWKEFYSFMFSELDGYTNKFIRFDIVTQSCAIQVVTTIFELNFVENFTHKCSAYGLGF